MAFFKLNIITDTDNEMQCQQNACQQNAIPTKCLGDFILMLFFFLRRFNSHYINSNLRVLRKNKVDTYVAPIFAPDYSATV